VAELQAITTAIATPSLRGMVSFVEGVLAAASGDHDEARRRFEDAVDLFDEGGAPYEAARSRLELGGALAALGRVDAAARELRSALSVLEQIGAARERERVAALLRHLEAAPERTGNAAAAAGLTRRELEILRLVAQGLSDKEAAVALSLSEHTVHRHISNVLNKLDVPSRTAAVAQAAQHGLL
jgi:DNA-binding CsgD family transcriptional regulator